ncbi:hypothetical protein Bbelb_336560 [Branchiostoma belcheri]|nr:hypothetical protein Bbelb_336560 [Branchiostoma belcheri]
MREGAGRWYLARRPLLTRLAAAALLSGTFSCVFFIYLTGERESALFKALKGGGRGLKTWNGSETQGGNVLRDGRVLLSENAKPRKSLVSRLRSSQPASDTSR